MRRIKVTGTAIHSLWRLSWSLLAFTLLICSGGCDEHTATTPDQITRRAPSSGPVPRAGRGVQLAWDPISGSLLYADPARGVIWWLADPLKAASAKAVRISGTPHRVAVTKEQILITTRRPSRLVLTERDHDRGIIERRSVELPVGASALAVSLDERLAIVTSATAGKVTAVSLPEGEILWTKSIRGVPGDVVIHASGAALVTDLLGGRATRLDHLASQPVTRELRLPHISLGGLAELSSDGRQVLILHQRSGTSEGAGHGRLDVIRIDDEEETLSPASSPVAGLGDAGSGQDAAIPDFPRSVLAKPSTDTVLIAGDSEVVELGRDGDLRRRWSTVTSSGPCLDPQGMALSADGEQLFLSCRDSKLARIELTDAAKIDVEVAALGPSLTVQPDCSAENRLSTPGEIAQKHRYQAGDVVYWEEQIRRYACRYPGEVELVRIGTSHEGRPITAMFIGHGVSLEHHLPAVLLNGGHHGSELLSTTMALDAVATLLEDGGSEVDRFLRELTVVVVPLVNPDGNWAALRSHTKGRKNGRDNDGNGTRDGLDGVDLNRNYPFRWGTLGEKASSSKPEHSWYRGPSAGSEPETQAMMRLAQSEHFVSSISFHTGTVAICPSYTIPGVEDPSPNEAWQVAEEIVATIPPHPERPWELRRNLYPLDGNDQDWHRFTHGTLALLVEGVDDEKVEWSVRVRAIDTVRATWQRLFTRFLDGPAITGSITDALGRPVEAQVSILETTTYENERWTSRCRDGRFARYLARPGRYTLRVEAPGVPAVERAVDVTAGGLARIDIALPALSVIQPICRAVVGRSGEEGTLIPIAVEQLASDR